MSRQEIESFVPGPDETICIDSIVALCPLLGETSQTLSINTFIMRAHIGLECMRFLD